MTTNFPLYDSLMRDTFNKELTIKQKKLFMTRIEEIDGTGKEFIYALIKYHFINTNKDSNQNDLYKCKIISGELGLRDLTWDLNDLPLRLRQILFKFTEINQKRQEELFEIQKSQIKMKNNNDV
jgi:hypothetical protein